MAAPSRDFHTQCSQVLCLFQRFFRNSCVSGLSALLKDRKLTLYPGLHPTPWWFSAHRGQDEWLVRLRCVKELYKELGWEEKQCVTSSLLLKDAGAPRLSWHPDVSESSWASSGTLTSDTNTLQGNCLSSTGREGSFVNGSLWSLAYRAGSCF